jgi:hypothetical protein
MDQKTMDTVFQQLGFATTEVMAAQVFNNGSFNTALIRTLTGRGIIVKITFGEERPDAYTIQFDAGQLLKDVSDKTFTIQWPFDVAQVLGKRGLTGIEALKYVSVTELKLLEGMTPRMLEVIMRELTSRQIFLQEYPSQERKNILFSTSIEQLGLPKRVQQSLLDERIYTIAMLASWTAEALAKLPGLGNSSVTDISRKLNNIGLQLRQPSFYDFVNHAPPYRRRI